MRGRVPDTLSAGRRVPPVGIAAVGALVAGVGSGLLTRDPPAFFGSPFFLILAALALFPIAPYLARMIRQAAALGGIERVRHIGGIAVHLGVLLIAAGGVLTALTRESGVLEVSEGERVPVRRDRFRQVLEGAGRRAPDFTGEVELSRFQLQYSPGGKIVNHTSDLRVWEGGASRRMMVRIGRPGRGAGVRFLQHRNFGVVCRLRFDPVAPPGKKPHDGPRRLHLLFDPPPLPQGPFSTRYEIHDLGAVLIGKGYPDAVEGGAGWESRSFEIRRPRLHLLLLPKSGPPREAVLAPGEALAIPEGKIRFEGMSYWTAFSVVRDPGEKLVFWGGALVAIALFLRLAVGERFHDG